MFDIAATLFEVDPARLRLRDGQVVVDGQPDSAIAIAEITKQIAPHTLIGRGAREPNPEDVAIRTFGAQCVEVEVDIDTGEVSVLRVATAHDCGRIVNPALVDSQVIGGVIQGVGYALSEERIVDERLGLVMNANLEEYHLPTVADVPPIANIHVGIPDNKANTTGAKGIGEPPLIPTAPAIANAVYDAIGVRLREGPLTRRRLLDALALRDGERAE